MLEARDIEGQKGLARKEAAVSEACAELAREDRLASELSLQAEELELQLELEEEREREDFLMLFFIGWFTC